MCDQPKELDELLKAIDKASFRKELVALDQIRFVVRQQYRVYWKIYRTLKVIASEDQMGKERRTIDLDAYYENHEKIRAWAESADKHLLALKERLSS